MITAKRVGADEENGTEAWRITGALEAGTAVDAVLELETDGREAWWDEDADGPHETGGVEPGDEDSGWDEVLAAITAQYEAEG